MTTSPPTTRVRVPKERARGVQRSPCCVVELHLARLRELARLVAQFEPVPHLPSSQRDLSLVVDENVAWSRVESLVRGAAGDHLVAIEFSDVYRGRQIPKGKKSLYFTLTYRGAERTLH